MAFLTTDGEKLVKKQSWSNLDNSNFFLSFFLLSQRNIKSSCYHDCMTKTEKLRDISNDIVIIIIFSSQCIIINTKLSILLTGLSWKD